MYWGQHTFDALGKYAPQCTINRWLLLDLKLELRVRLPDIWIRDYPYLPYLEECFLGAALQPLLAQIYEHKITFEDLPDDAIDQLLNASFAQSAEIGMKEGLRLLDDSRKATIALTRLLG